MSFSANNENGRPKRWLVGGFCFDVLWAVLGGYCPLCSDVLKACHGILAISESDRPD